MSTADGLFGERYLLGASLGVGSTSAVYEAEDVRDPSGKRVAVKVLHPHLCTDGRFRAAFLREAERLGALRQENIAAVRGWGVHDAGGVAMAWIALDLVPGPDLSAWVAANGPMAPGRAAAVLDGVLAGLAEAHRHGVVHRDLSPRNVLLDGEMARLIDFGLAAAAGGTTVGADLLLATSRAGGAATTGTVVGNAQYMAPEQASGGPVTEVSDLYAAGALLSFLLTGQPPYPRDTVEEILAAQVSAPPPVPSALVPAAHPLDRVVTTAMTKDPRHRFQSADEFRLSLAGALRAAADGERPATRVLPAADPRPIGRPRSGAFAAAATTAAIVGVVALALLTGFAGVLVPVAAAPPPPEAAASASGSPATVEKVEVPTLHGTLAEAETALALAGLRLGRIRRADSAQPADHVLSQSPAAGRKLQQGSAVDVVIASGENAVPDVVGRSAGSAGARLQSAGFSVSSNRAEPDPTTVVVGVEPAAGTRLRIGVTVTLVLADPAGAEPSPTPAEDTEPSPAPSESGG